MKFNISMPVAFYNKMKGKAEELGMNISQYIRYALTMFWKSEDKGER